MCQGTTCTPGRRNGRRNPTQHLVLGASALANARFHQLLKSMTSRWPMRWANGPRAAAYKGSRSRSGMLLFFRAASHNSVSTLIKKLKFNSTVLPAGAGTPQVPFPVASQAVSEFQVQERWRSTAHSLPSNSARCHVAQLALRPQPMTSQASQRDSEKPWAGTTLVPLIDLGPLSFHMIPEPEKR
jgi:hypothetical protein